MAQAAPGGLVCVNPRCGVAGLPTTRDACVSCKQPTRLAGEAYAAVAALPPPRPAGDGGQKVMDMISRVIFGGFWAVVTVIAVVGGIALLANGMVGGLLLLVIAVLAGLYSRYVFRGGRFRLLFW